jgi:SAM-dependent methyltransferase
MEYTGVDLNGAMCRIAEETLRSLRIKTRLVCADFEKPETFSNLSTFDFILCVHSTYYLSSLDTFLERTFKLLSPEEGRLIIIVQGLDELQKITSRFWKHQHEIGMKYSHDIQFSLEKQHIPYNLREVCLLYDITALINGDDKASLNSFLHADLEVYPSAVKEVAVKYLKSISTTSETTPRRYYLPRKPNMFVVKQN